MTHCICSLEGKTAIVTGAAMGIGFGIAKRFADAGASVLLADVDQGAASAAASRLSEAGGRIHPLAIDVGDDVQVNAILPGGITTEGASRPLEGSGMTREQMDDMRARFVEKIPLRRMGVPDDIAKVALFLASSASDYMTGAHVVVDGGALLT